MKHAGGYSAFLRSAKNPSIATARASVRGENSVYADLLFVAPGDCRLQSDSPAAGKGFSG
jgi:hypothetical protein